MHIPSLSSARLVGYGLLGFPLAVMGIPLYVYLPAFYAEDVGLPVATAGACLFLARFADTVTDPVIGYLSDRCDTRLGRRLPWMLAGAPLLLLGAWKLFVPTPGVTAAYLLGWSLVAYLGWTLLLLPYSAMGAELSDGFHERSRVTAAREAAVIAGTLVAVLLPGWLEWQGAARADSLETLAMVLLVALPPCLAMLVVAVRPWKTGGALRAAITQAVSWHEGRQLLRENAVFRRLLFAYLLNGLANGLPASLFLLFVAHLLHASAWSGLFLAAYFGAGVLMLPFWLRLSRRYGKHRAWVASMVFASLVFSAVPFLGNGDAGWFLAICLLSGASLGVDQALPASMQADVIDVDTAGGGGGRAGLYFGLWSMATKLSLALAVGIAFFLLGLAGFDPAASSHPPGALLTLSLLYGLLPVMFKLPAAWLMRDFPLDAERHFHLRADMAGGANP